MITTQFGRQAVLATATLGAVLLSLGAGPASAGHGYGMTQHPLRGDFPVAQGVAQGMTQGATAHVEQRAAPAVQEMAVRGDWLRGDFPRAPSGTLTANAGADGDRKVLTEAESQAAGFPALRREQVQLLPGVALKVGAAETAITGDVWTCPVTQARVLQVNTETTPATMRVFHLIPE